MTAGQVPSPFVAQPAAPASKALQLWSLALPVLKCAVCPACLSLFGGAFAGARMGFLGNERFHMGIILVALLADFFILRAAMKHHQNKWPMLLCISGAVLAVLGHFTHEALEFIGFGLLIVAAVHNVVLLRQHRKQGGACCSHDAHDAAMVPVRQAH